MFTLILSIHIFVAIFLVLLVLLQSGRGAEMGAAFGGVGQTQHIPSAATFISKLTNILAIIFMITCLTLAYLSSEKSKDSVIKKIGEVETQKKLALPAIPEKDPKTTTKQEPLSTQPKQIK